jgi:hypothetical protein
MGGTYVSLIRNSVIRKSGAIILAGFFMVSTATMVEARDRDDKCEQRVHKTERNVERAVQKHGEHSRQAEKQRHEMEEAREKCGHRDHDRDRH